MLEFMLQPAKSVTKNSMTNLVNHSDCLSVISNKLELVYIDFNLTMATLPF